VKVLVVDDDTFERQVYSLIFGKEGMCVDSANDVDSAIEKAKSFAPDIVILDLHLAEGSGFDVVRALKLDPLTKNIPIIFLSSDSDPKSARISSFVGAIDYLEKGSDVERLAKYVKEMALVESISNSLKSIKRLLQD
jgi:twitching motility two-component system response regulator PilH